MRYSGSMDIGIRQRARRSLRHEIAKSVSKIFVERGFDVVTVEAAAKEAGISRATFFRYFGSKEDAVMAAIEDDITIDFGAVLDALASNAGESAWQLLARTFTAAFSNVDSSSQQMHATLRMIHSNTTLSMRMTERRLAYEDSLAQALCRKGVTEDASHPCAVAAIAAVGLAWRRWAGTQHASLVDTLNRTFGELESAGEPIITMSPGGARYV